MARFQLPAGIHVRSLVSPGTTIVYPLVYGLADEGVERRINGEIAQTVALMQREQAKAQTGTGMTMTGHFEIKTNERGLLSLILTNYAYSRPMAHGFTIAKSLTFDVNTGRRYRLGDLFKPGSDYSVRLTEAVAAQVKRRDLPLLHGLPPVSPDQDYYLADKALVLYYQLYDIAPYYVGFPMFPISVYDLASAAAEQRPLAVLSADVV